MAGNDGGIGSDPQTSDMRLSSSQYARGLLRWSADRRITVATATGATPEDAARYSEPLTDSSGSLCTSEDLPVMGILPAFPEGRPSTIRIVWERVLHGAVRTSIWRDLDKAPQVLRHVPDEGTFHRLVVEARDVGWSEDVVFRTGHALIRFVDGTVQIEEAKPFDKVRQDGNQWVFEGGGSGTATATGRFIDLVAPGASSREAEQNAYAMLGGLALALGDHVIGSVVSSEAYEADAESQRGLATVGMTVKVPRGVAPGEFDALREVLWAALTSDRAGRARRLSLRWYERGLRSLAPLDKMLSHFIAIETVVSAYSTLHEPLPVEVHRRETDQPLLDLVTKQLGKKVTGRLASRLRGTTLTERFDFYAKAHELGELVEGFKSLKSSRDRAIHGDVIDVTEEMARESEQVATAVLKAEFDLKGTLPWEQQPSLYGMKVGFEFVESQALA